MQIQLNAINHFSGRGTRTPPSQKILLLKVPDYFQSCYTPTRVPRYRVLNFTVTVDF